MGTIPWVSQNKALDAQEREQQQTVVMNHGVLEGETPDIRNKLETVKKNERL